MTASAALIYNWTATVSGKANSFVQDQLQLWKILRGLGTLASATGQLSWPLFALVPS